MMDIWQILQESWAIRAFVASTMVGITCGVLGAFIVLRNMALIGDALSHAILPGVVVAFVILGYNTLGFFFGSVIAGLVSAVIITWIQQHVRTKNDAVIGIVFTAMFSAGVIGISYISKTGVHLDLKDFLFGNVLGVSNEDLWLTGLVMVAVVLSITLLYRYLFASTFQPTIATTMGIPVQVMHYYLMLLLSFSVVAAMQTVGVILVVAMLITPASTALLLHNRLPQVLLTAGIIGFFSSLLGLMASIIYEMPPGPAIAVMATIIYLLAAVFAPEKGLLGKWVRKRQQQKNILLEDVLKAAYKLTFDKNIETSALASLLNTSEKVISSSLQKLLRIGWLSKENQDTFHLTDEGKVQANKLIRAHRLWESYLVNEMGMEADQIHQEAEHYEHFLTSEEVDAVDRKLGYPTLDPHGSPIPGKESQPGFSLFQLAITDQAIIALRQPGADITYKLWSLGLGPGDTIRVKERGDGMVIETKEKDIMVPQDLARQVSVEKV